METLAAINRWLAKQHVVTGASVKTRRCGAQMPLLLRSRARGLYVMSEDKTRHAQMTGQQAKVAGTVNGQPKTVALIRGSSSKVKFVARKGRATRNVTLYAPLSGGCGAKSPGVGNPP